MQEGVRFRRLAEEIRRGHGGNPEERGEVVRRGGCARGQRGPLPESLGCHEFAGELGRRHAGRATLRAPSGATGPGAHRQCGRPRGARRPGQRPPGRSRRTWAAGRRTFHVRRAIAAVRMPRMEPGPSQKAKAPTASISTSSSSRHSKTPDAGLLGAGRPSRRPLRRPAGLPGSSPRRRREGAGGNVPENLAEAGHLAKLTKRARNRARKPASLGAQSGIDPSAAKPTLDPYFIRIETTALTP